MDWSAFFDALGPFILKIGVPSILILSVPVLLWKYWDTHPKVNRPS